MSQAIVNLGDVDTQIEILDFDYTFFYKRVFTPGTDPQPTGLFELFYKEQSAESWFVKNGLLSNYYSIAKTSDVIEHIRGSLGAELYNERHYRLNTVVRSEFTLRGFEVTLEDDNRADKLLFKLLTNVDANIDTTSNAKLSFNVTNDYSGTHKLELNYGFLKTISQENGEGRSIQSNNVFLLDDYSSNLIHDRLLAISFEEVQNIRSNVGTRVEVFKQFPITVDVLRHIEQKFPKKFNKKFMALYDELPDDFRNFYYCSFIWSIILRADRKLGTEMALRKYVKEYIGARTPQPMNA